MTVFFLICRRYISIFQLIRECWIWCFDCNILSRQVLLCRSSFWESWLVYHPFWCLSFTVYIIDFPSDVLNIKIFKQKYFWIFKRTFCLQNTWMVFVFLIAFSTGSVSSITSVIKLSSFSIFNSLTTLLKNSLKVSEDFASALKMFAFSRRVIWEFVEQLFFENKRFIVFQKILLCVILLISRDSSYFCFLRRNSLTQ